MPETTAAALRDRILSMDPEEIDTLVLRVRAKADEPDDARSSLLNEKPPSWRDSWRNQV